PRQGRAARGQRGAGAGSAHGQRDPGRGPSDHASGSDPLRLAHRARHRVGYCHRRLRLHVLGRVGHLPYGPSRRWSGRPRDREASPSLSARRPLARAPRSSPLRARGTIAAMALDTLLATFPRERTWLLPALQAVQRAERYLSPDALEAVAAHLRVPKSEVRSEERRVGKEWRSRWVRGCWTNRG